MSSMSSTVDMTIYVILYDVNSQSILCLHKEKKEGYFYTVPHDKITSGMTDRDLFFKIIGRLFPSNDELHFIDSLSEIASYTAKRFIILGINPQYRSTIGIDKSYKWIPINYLLKMNKNGIFKRSKMRKIIIL